MRVGHEPIWVMAHARRVLDAPERLHRGGPIEVRKTRGRATHGMHISLEQMVAAMDEALKRRGGMMALEAVQAILSPDERKVPLDEQSRRRSLAAKRRSLSLKHVKSSTSSSGSGSLPLV